LKRGLKVQLTLHSHQGEIPEDQDMQIGLDDMDREQMQNYEDGQYGTMEGSG